MFPGPNGDGGTNEGPAPVVLITNPKDARYVLPGKEPLGRMQKSTHIRFLVFSSAPILDVHFSIDGERVDGKAVFIGTESAKRGDHLPLWAIQWNPERYADNQAHELIVEAVDEGKRVGRHVIPFRLDGQPEVIASRIGEFIMTAAVSSWARPFIRFCAD